MNIEFEDYMLELIPRANAITNMARLFSTLASISRKQVSSVRLKGFIATLGAHLPSSNPLPSNAVQESKQLNFWQRTR
jgi:hypothetical protein